MFYLVGIVAFVLSIIFYAWHLGHGVWTWTLFMLIGFLCMALAGRFPNK